MHLDRYNRGDYNPGAALLTRVLWYFVGSPLFSSRFFPSSAVKAFLLRIFGARVGKGVRIKPGVHVKHPWRFDLGDFSWLGEGAWIDNIAPVLIGSHCCISQDVYLCTGNHNWAVDSFDLCAAEIRIESHSWIAARAVVGPGITVGEGAILLLGGVAVNDLQPWQIYRGNPAVSVGRRRNVREDK